METTSTLSNNVAVYYDKTALEAATKRFIVQPLGREQSMPKGTGSDTYKIKWGHISPVTSTLTEGVVPTETTIDTNRYTITVNEYGQVISMTEKLVTSSIDVTTEKISEELGYAAGDSAEQVIVAHLVANATTNTQYAASGNTADNDISATEVLTLQDVVKGARIMRANYAPTFSDGYYVWVVNPWNAFDIMTDTSAGGFIDLNHYTPGNADKVLKGEIGKGYGVRVIETPNITATANGSTVNVYRTLLLAQDAFVVSKWEQDMIKVMITAPGGQTDPLSQIYKAGYKMRFGVKYIGGSFTNHNGASPDLCIQIRGAATGG